MHSFHSVLSPGWEGLGQKGAQGLQAGGGLWSGFTQPWVQPFHFSSFSLLVAEALGTSQSLGPHPPGSEGCHLMCP